MHPMKRSLCSPSPVAHHPTEIFQLGLGLHERERFGEHHTEKVCDMNLEPPRISLEGIRLCGRLSAHLDPISLVSLTS